jgi:thiol-disulfide isomerase/thioredoxin
VKQKANILGLTIGLLAILIALAIIYKTGTAQNTVKKGPKDETAAPLPPSPAADADKKPKRTYPLPPDMIDAEIKTLDGKNIKLSDFHGKVILLNQWATWCGPCRTEMPDIVKMSEEYKDKPVVFIGITTIDDRGNTEPTIRNFVQQNQIPYPIAIVSDNYWSNFSELGKYSIPQSFIINKNGEVTAIFAGYSPTRTPQGVRQAIENALADE